MREIDSLNALNIPADYKTYIQEYIQNISTATFINKIILFGSCARESVVKYSDIDMFITTNREITENEEIFLMFKCLPEYSINTIPIDIIVQPENIFDSYTNSIGMVQKQVAKEGVDLSGLLRKCARN